MTRASGSNLWLDIPIEIGDGANPERDYALAVHLTLYWAQNLRQGPVCNTISPTRQLAEQLRKGMPLSDEEISTLGLGYWPPADNDLNIDTLPPNVPPTALVDGPVEWTLSRERLKLYKETRARASTYVSDVEISAGATVRIRQTIGYRGPLVPAPGTPRNLKLISAVCGVYDGGIRCLPKPMLVDTLEDVEAFLAMLENADRKQYVVAIAATNGDGVDGWITDIEQYAREAFALQHVVAITSRGLSGVREMLGDHGLPPGAIKTYRPSFSVLDIQQAHRITSRAVVMQLGLAGTLNLWRKRLMERDAWDRRYDVA
jgi:hypothetical protein